jgi:hypothetical protein
VSSFEANGRGAFADPPFSRFGLRAAGRMLARHPALTAIATVFKRPLVQVAPGIGVGAVLGSGLANNGLSDVRRDDFGITAVFALSSIPVPCTRMHRPDADGRFAFSRPRDCARSRDMTSHLPLRGAARGSGSAGTSDVIRLGRRRAESRRLLPGR